MSASPDANRYANLELKMECPNCGSGGMIPWKQLNHVLMCHGCDKRYRVQASGLVEMPQSQEDRIRIQVRTNSSGVARSFGRARAGAALGRSAA